VSDLRVGVIGLGAMGGAVADRLLAEGFTTWVHDLNRDAVERLVANGADTGPLEEASWDILVTSLPSDDSVRGALVDTGALRQLAGGVLVELSTILPATMSAVAAEASKADVGVVDSPVSGGPAEARAGKLVLLVGAEDRMLDRARPVLEAIGTVEHVGDVADGKAIKLVNNVMAMGNMVVAAEAFALGTTLGLDPARMFDTLSRSGGRSHHFLKRMPYVLERDFSARFALYLGEKDLRLALETAHQEGYAMPAAACIHQIYEIGMAKGWGAEDIAAVVKVYEDWSPAHDDRGGG